MECAAIYNLNKLVMDSIENNPGKYCPIAFIRNMDFKERIRWIEGAINTFDNIKWTYNYTDIPDKCVVAKVYREARKRNINEFDISSVSYMDCLSYCEEKYPMSFLIVHDSAVQW